MPIWKLYRSLVIRVARFIEKNVVPWRALRVQMESSKAAKKSNQQNMQNWGVKAMEGSRSHLEKKHHQINAG